MILKYATVKEVFYGCIIYSKKERIIKGSPGI